MMMTAYRTNMKMFEYAKCKIAKYRIKTRTRFTNDDRCCCGAFVLFFSDYKRNIHLFLLFHRQLPFDQPRIPIPQRFEMNDQKKTNHF